METLCLGRHLAGASRIALGCMRMASHSLQEASQVLETARQVGINFFDHADIYGRGESEVRFAQAVKELGIARDQLLIQSKCGIRLPEGYFDFSSQHILDSVDGILKRLKTDYLDVLLLHRPDALMEPDQVAAAFDRLHAAGKVRYFGVSNQNPYQIELLQASVSQPLIINQLQLGPAHTPMIDAGLNVNMREAAGINRDGGILDYCRLKGITIQPWSPFQVDLHQGVFMTHPDYQLLTETLSQGAKQHGVAFEAMVIAWLLRHPAGFQPIVGTMSPKRIEALAQAERVQMTRQEWYDIYKSAGNRLP